MTWEVVKGRYKQGFIELPEEVPDHEGTEVLVLFPERRTTGEYPGLWQRMKRTIAAEMPGLLEMTDEERKKEFDMLSSKIADNMPYRSLEEFEQAMRGDTSSNFVALPPSIFQRMS